MFGKGRKKRAMNKVKPGDGRPLKPFRFWQPLSRSLFYLDRTDIHGHPVQYAVDVDYFAATYDAHLYTDGKQSARSTLPAVFPVEGGVVEVESSTFGMTRMHFVSDDGQERVLRPDPASGEGLRASFDHKHPVLSKLIGAVAIVILLASLVILFPQLLEWITTLDIIADNIGTFTSPLNLPSWLNSAVFIGGIAASVERALMLRSHWLIDAETWWLGE